MPLNQTESGAPVVGGAWDIDTSVENANANADAAAIAASERVTYTTNAGIAAGALSAGKSVADKFNNV